MSVPGTLHGSANLNKHSLWLRIKVLDSLCYILREAIQISEPSRLEAKDIIAVQYYPGASCHVVHPKDLAAKIKILSCGTIAIKNK